MNAKYIIFKALAILISIMSAIASARAVAPGQTHLKYTTCGGTVFCTTLGNLCNAGPNLCKVSLRVNSIPVIVTGWNHGCTIRLQMTGTSPIVTNLNKNIPSCFTIDN
jgi:hypothetical protein